MNLQGKVKRQEYPAGAGTGSSSYIPQPMEGLHDTGPPPFLTKTYDIVEDPSTNRIVSWSRGNKSFIVWDPEAFSVSLLPKYFKHNNFSSFVRQLNTYGFRKVDPDRWEFANEGFLRGQKCLLKSIRRRRTPQPRASQQSLDPCVEVGWFGLDGEVDRLRRDKQLLMVELVKLRQQQQNTKACLQLMEQRLRRTETKQQQMMGFLARAMRNPNFVQQLVQQKDRRKEHEEEINKKRRRPIDKYPSNVDQVGEFGNVNGEVGPFVKVELQEFGDLSELDQFSELQAIDMHGPSGDQENLEEVHVEEFGEEQGGKSKDLEEGFWVGLLNEDVEREIGILGGDIEDGEGVDVLVERLGYLASSPN